MKQPTCLITGVTSGIGKATALGLAKLGHRLILIGRNHKKLDKMLESIGGQWGNNELRAYRCDLSLLHDVRSVSEKIKSEYSRIEVMINNAGARSIRH